MQETPQQKPYKPRKPRSIDRKEWQRLLKLHLFENAAREKGFCNIAGIDEAGRGPLAGPVVAAACIIPQDVFIIGVNDSKQLTPIQRKKIYEEIVADNRIQYGIGIVSHIEIDQLNIYQASIKAMELAVAKLTYKPDYLLVDGIKLGHEIPSEKIVGGDGKSHSIAAASVLAKVTRDQIMIEEHQKWPCYGFDKHKGYATEEHLKAIEKHGPCPIHRMSFEPLKQKI